MSNHVENAQSQGLLAQKQVLLQSLATELAAQVSTKWVVEEHRRAHTYQLTVWGSCPILPEVRE